MTEHPDSTATPAAPVVSAAMASAPVVSVIVPVFNRAEAVQAALDSIRRQDFSDLEVIVVDDGSSPPLELAAAPGLRVLRHAGNRGAAAARNSGVAAARGRYVAFLDSDDGWLPGKLARQVAALDAAGAQVIGCLTGFSYWRGVGRPAEAQPARAVADWHRYFLAGCRCSPGTTLMLRREAFEAVGPQDESLRRLEDWDWLLRAAARGYRFAALPEVLAEVRLGGRPDPAVVEAALARLAAKHLAGLRRPGERRTFRAALALERAALAAWNRRPLRALAQGALALAGDPAAVLRHLRRRGR